MHVAGACRTWGDLNPEERSKQLLDRFKKYTQKVWGWGAWREGHWGAGVHPGVRMRWTSLLPRHAREKEYSPSPRNLPACMYDRCTSASWTSP